MKGYYRDAIDENEKARLYEDITEEEFDLNKTVLQDSMIDKKNQKKSEKNEVNREKKNISRVAVIALITVTFSIMICFIAILIKKGAIHASNSKEVGRVVQNDNENALKNKEDSDKEKKIIEDSIENEAEVEITDEENAIEGQSNKLKTLDNKLKELYKKHREVQPILKFKDKYPYSLLKDIVRNPEMIDFALGYLKGKNKTYSDNIDITQDVSNDEYGMPLLIQWDKRWGYYNYGNSVIGISGCGPTSLSMVYVHLTGDYSMNPIKMAKFCVSKSYVAPGVGTSWNLMKEGAEKLGLVSFRIAKSKQVMINQLQQGNPIIASMGPGIFTDRGHFIVFRKYENGHFYVNDPFCIKHTKMAWTYEQFCNQIKALWAYSY